MHKVEQIFRGDLEESGSQVGIDRNELTKGINRMRKNIGKHGIPSKKIDAIEKELKKKVR